GETLTAATILSSAGYVETLRLCDDCEPEPLAPLAGRLSFVEIISILDAPLKHLGHDTTIVFYNTAKAFHYEVPKDLVDPRSGVICCPDKFKTGRTHLENLFICGNDQGFLGIVGAMLSGISMANLHVLKK